MNSGSILDIGCGVGAFMQKCPPKYSIFGQEINSTCVEYCLSQGLDVKEDLPYGQKFDAITMFDVLEHFDDLSIIFAVLYFDTRFMQSYQNHATTQIIILMPDILDIG